MDEKTNHIVNKFTEDIKEILGTNLNQAILYGSYARGNNSHESDIDIMILIDIEESDIEFRKARDVIIEHAVDFLMEYDVDISPIVANTNHFEYWIDALPFYQNVRQEGVVLYG